MGVFFKYIGSVPVGAAVLLLTVYKKMISPFLPKACRYYPTCSEYSVTAFKKHGFMKGLWLTVKRVLRCNSLFPGGYDPVP